MKKFLLLTSLILFAVSLQAQMKVYKGFNDIQPRLSTTSDTIYVVNLWATWCAPCVAELPAFEKLNKKFRNQKIKVLLISLDMPRQIERALIPFIEKNKIQSEVVVLDDPDSNNWINKISPEWSGAIPATIIFDKNKRKFYERTFTFEELENEVLKFNPLK